MFCVLAGFSVQCDLTYRDKPAIPPEPNPSESRSCGRTAPAGRKQEVSEADNRRNSKTDSGFRSTHL